MRALPVLLGLLALATPPSLAEELTDDTAWLAPKRSLLTEQPGLTPARGDYGGGFRERNSLIGDVAGHRQALLEHGVAIDASLTQLPQGVVGGGVSDSWEYAATADYRLFLDSGRLGLWPGGLLTLHGETRFGNSVNANLGAVSVANFDYAYLDTGEGSQSFLTEYYLVQELTHWMSFVFGRAEWTNFVDRNRFANDETTQFINASLRNSALLGSVVSSSTHGGALVFELDESVTLTLLAVDSTDVSPITGSVDGFFDEVTAGGEIEAGWAVGPSPGAARAAFFYDTKNIRDLDNRSYVSDVVDALALPDLDENWIVNVNLEQYLYVASDEVQASRKRTRFELEPEGIGLFLRTSLSSKSRNPWDVFVSGGIGGRGVIPTRANDRYGLGFYALFPSEDLGEQPLLGSLENEWGLELYYNFAVTPWLQISPDVQYVQSSLPAVDDAVVLAFRVQLDL